MRFEMDLGKLATHKNAEEGVWFEPVVFGYATGVEFRVLGADSDVVRKQAQVSLNEIRALTQPQQERINFVERNREAVVVRVLEIRGKEGKPVILDGAEVENTAAGYRKIFIACPEIQDAVKAFSDKRANFLPEEKETSNEQSDASSSSITHTASDEGKKDK